jgi:hypothetical protein
LTVVATPGASRDLLPRGAVTYRGFGMNRDTAITPQSDRDRERDQFAGFRTEQICLLAGSAQRLITLDGIGAAHLIFRDELGARMPAFKCAKSRRVETELIGGTAAALPFLPCGDLREEARDETSIDWRRRRCHGNFRHGRTGTGYYRRPRLSGAVLLRRKWSDARIRQSAHQ